MSVQAVDATSRVTPTTPPENPNDAAAFDLAVLKARHPPPPPPPPPDRPPPDYRPPTDWNATPEGGADEGKDPFNVIISGNSTVSMDDLMGALDAGESDWRTVPSQQISWRGLGVGAEQANVEPPGQGGRQDQDLSAREGGQWTMLGDDVNHLRAYRQEATGAWFIAASKERPKFPWGHDINTFDGGRQDLVADIRDAAAEEGWNVDVRMVQGQPPGTGSSDVPYDGKAAVVTIRA